MAEHLYEGGFTLTTGAAAAPFGEIIAAAIAAGKRLPEIREIGIFNQSGVAAEIGVGRPAAIGITPATLTTVQALHAVDVIAGNTTIAKTWGTAPTAPTNFMRRAELQGVVGAGIIWTWGVGEFAMWSASAIGTIVLWQISALAVTYDCYVKVAE
jgi:hypothetical protein